MSPAWAVQTGRLILTPVAWTDLADLRALKSDPRAFAMMLGGVRDTVATDRELAQEIRFWAAHGFGLWAVRSRFEAAFLGITGLVPRPDGRGTALRFAFWPEVRGHGLAREAAGVALRFGHERAGLPRIIAIARDSNIASRTVLGSIGMVEREAFLQSGYRMLLYESTRSETPSHPFALTCRFSASSKA